MADNWRIDASELEDLFKTLELFETNLEPIAKKAINAGTRIVKKEMSVQMPRSKMPRLPGKKLSIRKSFTKEKWRTGKHAADNIELTGFKTSLQGSVYKVVGPQSQGDYFYMHFFESGRQVYNKKTGSLDGFQHPRSYMQPTVEKVQNEVIEKMKKTIKKETGWFD